MITNEEKDRARRMVTAAKTRGDLIPGPCRVCGGDKNIDAHHEDYTRPLDVTWLCQFHHKERHREMRAAALKVKVEKPIPLWMLKWAEEFREQQRLQPLVQKEKP